MAMEHIGGNLQKIEQNIEIVGADLAVGTWSLGPLSLVRSNPDFYISGSISVASSVI